MRVGDMWRGVVLCRGVLAEVLYWQREMRGWRYYTLWEEHFKAQMTPTYSRYNQSTPVLYHHTMSYQAFNPLSFYHPGHNPSTKSILPSGEPSLAQALSTPLPQTKNTHSPPSHAKDAKNTQNKISR